MEQDSGFFSLLEDTVTNYNLISCFAFLGAGQHSWVLLLHLDVLQPLRWKSSHTHTHPFWNSISVPS